MTKRLIRIADRVTVAEKCRFADTFFSRMRGMIGRRFKNAGFDAMVFENCNAVHCCWMIETIDILFTTADLKVVKICKNVKPWCLAWGGKGSETTIELPAGTLAHCGIETGDCLGFE